VKSERIYIHRRKENLKIYAMSSSVAPEITRNKIRNEQFAILLAFSFYLRDCAIIVRKRAEKPEGGGGIK